MSGKNKNKINETTPQQQAILEAESEYSKKIKHGYTTTQHSLDSVGLKPMLAQPFGPKNMEFPVFVQPKLDGVRCLVHRGYNNELRFQSRHNTVYEPFQHIVPELDLLYSRLPNGIVLDGELYHHGMGFEKITGIVRRSKNPHPEKEKIQFHIYDCFFPSGQDDFPFSERSALLRSAFEGIITHNICLVETLIARNEEAIHEYHNFFTTMEIPYEGIMIRTSLGQYSQQRRSKDLQKLKTFLDEDFTIIGHHEGIGTHKGTPIFICCLQDDPCKTFNVMLQGSLENRKKMMTTIKDYYGKRLTVKFQEKSDNGIPRFPVGIEIRDYE